MLSHEVTALAVEVRNGRVLSRSQRLSGGMFYILVTAEGVIEPLSETVTHALKVRAVAVGLILARSGREGGTVLLLFMREGVAPTLLDCFLERAHALVGVRRREGVLVL
jgi:hypothetical protein